MNKMKKTKTILAVIVLIALIIIAIICFSNFFGKSKETASSTSETNDSQEIQQEESKINEIKRIDGYEIFNAQISVVRGITNFKGYIRNTSNVTQNNKEFSVEILGNDEEVLGKIAVHVEKIEPNQIVAISGNLMKGIKDEKDYRIVEK